MSRYLVTGAAGFIGSHLCEALEAQGTTFLVVLPVPLWSLQRLAARM